MILVFLLAQQIHYKQNQFSKLLIKVLLKIKFALQKLSQIVIVSRQMHNGKVSDFQIVFLHKQTHLFKNTQYWYIVLFLFALYRNQVIEKPVFNFLKDFWKALVFAYVKILVEIYKDLYADNSYVLVGVKQSHWNLFNYVFQIFFVHLSNLFRIVLWEFLIKNQNHFSYFGRNVLNSLLKKIVNYQRVNFFLLQN